MMKQVNIKTPLRMLGLLLGLFLSVGAFAQIDVKGHVKDATGEDIIGATVRVVGTQTATVTDFEGNFVLQANQGADITISFIGFQTATVKAAPTIEVTLQDDQTVLSDVVVIGYGRAKKSDLTGSVTSMKPDEMSKGITNNASDMLVGKVAGVDVITDGGTPGAGAQIRIRGGASLNASNDPLYVIDGLVIDNNTAKGMTNILAMVNPNDIENFTVLKDASATAIYGSRASNGVIIITTKKGKSGTAPKISYNGDVTISTIAKKYDVLDAAGYKNLISSIDGLDASLLGNANTDWQDEIFRTAVSTQHSISVSGGLKNMPYRFSAGVNTAKGIIKESKMNRANIGLNLAPSLLNDKLKINITTKFMYEKNNYVDAGGAIGSALAMDPTQPVRMYGPDGRFTGNYYQTLQGTSDAITDPTWTKTTNSNAPQNPVALLDLVTCKARAYDYSGNIEADYILPFLEDLHIHASLGAQYTDSHQDDWSAHESYGANYFGWEGITNYWKYNIVGSAYAQYIKEIGIHNIDIMAGAEQSHYHRNGYDKGQGTDPYTGNANNPRLRSESEWASHNSLLSYFGRLNYNLLDRYMLTATFRADGSSRFAKGKKWGYFPSVAIAWKINNEPFLKNANWLDELKLRLGWGKTGQQNGIDDFYYLPLYVRSNSYAQYPFGDTYYYTTRPNNYNPELTWEKTTTYNAGLDLMVLNGRFGINLDGYIRKTTDLLARVDIPAGTNFGDQQLRNIGSLKNYGLELAFDVKPIVTNDFTWQLTYNVGWNHNEITELNTGSVDYVTAGGSISRGNNTKIQRHKVGEPINSFFVYQQVYDENGKPLEGVFVDRNADGQINSDDGYYYKSPAADVIMGATTKFIYKNWDLSAAFHASLGNYVYYDFLSRNANVGPGLYANSAWRNTSPEAVALGWTAAANTYSNENYKSDYFVRNASYLKCTNITLGYTFKSYDSYLNGRVFATVQNPFIITKYKGIDPEVASGIDSNPYPRPLSIQLGLNLNF
jgi:iron complex outermembrane receptor protein